MFPLLFDYLIVLIDCFDFVGLLVDEAFEPFLVSCFVIALAFEG